ncbi:MsnO8 family LLM class oxidoreductase [Paenibacillus hodogayensis]|uniref:MsnO8 family LLM class oxidoreductase n=1 Tax=Paenibacillus hodogayensis TaxID=279208 RepID=A0ABV5VZE6_9BACL
MSLKLSILDKSPLHGKETAAEVLANTVELARAAERLGYDRFWVSEHHDFDSFACSSPEVLIGYLLARTERITIGSGGVMLTHYSPYKVAENFNMLSALAPGRVDLGVGRAPGGFDRSTKALQGEAAGAAVSFADKLEQLERYVRESRETDDATNEPDVLRARPIPPRPPALYLLGASAASAESAAKLGIPYVFSQWISGDDDVLEQALTVYRSAFDRSRGGEPRFVIGVSVLIAETEEEARRQTREFKVIRIELESGKSLRVGTSGQLEEFRKRTTEPFRVEERETIIIHGTTESVCRQLEGYHRRFGIDEMIISFENADFAQRLLAAEAVRSGLAGLLGPRLVRF